MFTRSVFFCLRTVLGSTIACICVCTYKWNQIKKGRSNSHNYNRQSSLHHRYYFLCHCNKRKGKVLRETPWGLRSPLLLKQTAEQPNSGRKNATNIPHIKLCFVTLSSAEWAVISWLCCRLLWTGCSCFWLHMGHTSDLIGAHLHLTFIQVQ